MYTNYRCIPFPPKGYHVSYYHLEFPIQHCQQYIFLLSLKKKAEMSFLSVNDFFLVCIVKFLMRIRCYRLLKNMISLKINKKLPLEKCVCLLWKVLAAWFPVLRLKMTSNFVSAHGHIMPKYGWKVVQKKNPPLFYPVCLRSFGALSGWAYPQYRLCGLFMIMEHSCDDISDREWKTTSIILVKRLKCWLVFFQLR